MKNHGIPRVVVVGAGVGGLVTAAMLARAGLDVTMLEAHVYPGGCAGSFYHQGYRFDVGATLSAGFEPGGVMTGLGEALGINWPVELAHEAMVVHLPDASPITRWTDPARWQAERTAAFGAQGAAFWRWQETTGDDLWRIARGGLPWPPATMGELAAVGCAGLRLVNAVGVPTGLDLALDVRRTVSVHLPPGMDRLRQFVDAQLLISAQATSTRANALFGAAALDLPRRGVAHLHGGMGALSQLLTEAVRRQGGQVLFRQRVTQVIRENGRPARVETNKGGVFPADIVIFNLPPWDAEALLGSQTAVPPVSDGVPPDGWGAFILYAGIDAAIVPPDFSPHHQVVMREPLGEGNSVFFTVSLRGDAGRAPEGKAAVTLSTHTSLRPWWDLFEKDRPAYESRKDAWTERVWAAAERVLPGMRSATSLALPGTPVTFQRFTHRSLGWVGGFPQISLFRTRRPGLAPGLWLVGDSIFPGQSTLAVALGGLRVAGAVLASCRGTPARYQVLRPRESA